MTGVLYVYKKSNGKWFTDGEGNVLNIPSMRGDLSKIAELKEGCTCIMVMMEKENAVFVPGLSRVTDEEYYRTDGQI
jgi:hypothetical protein